MSDYVMLPFPELPLQAAETPSLRQQQRRRNSIFSPFAHPRFASQ